MNDLFLVVERAKQEWETAIDAISEGIIVFENDTLKIHRTNWPLARWFNTTPNELVGRYLHEIVCGCDQTACSWLALVRSPERSVMQTINGQTYQRWEVSVFQAQPSSQQEKLGVLVIRDITQEYLLQQQVIEAEKSAVILRIAAKIADRVIPSIGYIQHHLSMVMLNVQALRYAFTEYRVALQTSDDGLRSAMNKDWGTIESHYRVEFRMQDIREAINHSLEELNQIYNFTQRLKDLGGAAPTMRYNDLIDLLEETIHIVSEETQDLVVFDRRYEGHLPPIRCNQLHLQTAILYVLIFGIQAIRSHGKISISTARKDQSVQVVVETNASAPALVLNTTPELTSSRIQQETMSHMITSILEDMGGDFRVRESDGSSFAATVTLPIESVQVEE